MAVTSHIFLRFHFAVLAILLFCTNEVASQSTSPITAQDTATQEIVSIDQSNFLNVIRTRPGKEVTQLVGEVELSQDSIYMYCDSAELINEVQVYAYNNVIIQQGDSIAAFSNYLDYNAETQLADLRGNVVLQNGDRELYTDKLSYDLKTKKASYLTGGRLTDGTTQLYSTRGYYYAETDRIYFRDSVVVIGEQFELRADTLLYDAKTETVYFLGPTVIRTDTAEIYCENGFYNVANNQAVFQQNAQYRSGEQIATADSIIYFGERGEYVLDGDAYIREGDYSVAKAERITYQKELEKYTLEGQAFLKDSTRTVRGEYVEYDQLNNTYKVSGGRSTVVDGANVLEADKLDFDNATGLGLASGDVIWKDTSAQLEIRAENAQYNQENGYLKASGGKNGRALMITILDGDSLYTTADTLFSQEIDTATTITDSLLIEQPEKSKIRQISAYNDVRVYKSDMQALCDSMAFNTTDSILTLFDDPILWQDTSQLVADTIDIYLRNNALDKVHLKKKALVITSPDLIFFNQVKGKNIYAYFDSTQLRRTEVKGNAEVVYFAQDEAGAYIGVNKTACSAIVMYFKNGSIEFIRFLKSPSGQLDPMTGMTGTSQPKLDGFKWITKKRPKRPKDLF